MEDLLSGLSVSKAERLFKGWAREILIEHPKDPNNNNSLKLFTREEAGKLLRISLPSLDKLIKSRILESKRVGGRVLISEEDIMRYLGNYHG